MPVVRCRCSQQKPMCSITRRDFLAGLGTALTAGVFEETVAVFRRSGHVAPVFSDKHLSWNWDDAKWMYDTARELKVPLMAGSSLPITWRRPSLDLKRGARLSEAVGISYHTLDAYGF